MLLSMINSYLHQGGYIFIGTCSLLVRRIMQKLPHQVSQNLAERWHMSEQII